jgi:transposase-like protein
MDMWKKIIFNKDPEALKMMIEYCENDVVILENVYNKIKEYTTPKINYAVLNGGDKYECPECGSSNPQTNKTYTTTMGVTKHHMRCNVKSCGTTYTISNKTYIDLLKYKVLSKNYK